MIVCIGVMLGAVLAWRLLALYGDLSHAQRVEAIYLGAASASRCTCLPSLPDPFCGY